MTDDVVRTSGGRLTVARSRGAVTGVLLVLLGLWGALIPFVGPYFHFAYSPDKTWHWTAARGWFEVLPGGVAVVGGLLLIVSANRLLTSLGAWMAVAGGGWFVVAPTLAPVLTLGSIHGPVSLGVVKSTVETLSFFSGLGAVIVLVAAIAVGRLSVRSVRDLNAANAGAAAPVVMSTDPAPQEPVAQDPAPQEPVAQDLAPQEPMPQEPVAQEPVAQEPAPPTGPVEHPPGYGQRVPTYYSGGPTQRSEADDTPRRRSSDS
jgi:hypothetical protein